MRKREWHPSLRLSAFETHTRCLPERSRQIDATGAGEAERVGGGQEAGGAQAATIGEHRIGPSLARWRLLFKEVPDDRFEGIVRSLRVPESISGIAFLTPLYDRELRQIF